MKNFVKGLVLLVAFVGTIFISNHFLNQAAPERIIDMGRPTLPQVSFQVVDQWVNTLSGYVDQMDITSMRNTITPIQTNGTLTMRVERFGNAIEMIEYEVYSLDGTSLFRQGTVELDDDDTVVLVLGGALDASLAQDNAREAVLRITVHTYNRGIHYYTRINHSHNLSIRQDLNFAMNFHRQTFDWVRGRELAVHLEPLWITDNGTLQTVSNHSHIENVLWNGESPRMVGDVAWNITECNTVFTSILARYQIVISDENEVERYYNIREFFRVRTIDNEVFLLNYHRTMNQIFTGVEVFDSSHIILGIIPEEVHYHTNETESVIAFVQERELWVYDREYNRLALAFSFSQDARDDVRSFYDQHIVRIISMEENGSTAFAVFGYMNRGTHEGRVGVQFLFYDIERNVVEERAFLSSNQPFAFALDELGEMVYYNHEYQLLYIMVGGNLHEIDLENNRQIMLVSNLRRGQYVASGHLIAWQLDGALHTASSVQVKNLRTQESYTVYANEGEAVRPLGFMHGDFISGSLRLEDAGTTILGEVIHPMYKMEIRDEYNEVVKTYQQEGVFISDILLDTNLITLYRLSRRGTVYSGIESDFISSNVERVRSDISVTTFSTSRKLRQVRLTFPDGTVESSPQILRPNQVVIDHPITVAFDERARQERFVVFARGDIVGIYDRAVYAIQRADRMFGVVISSDQAYVWERGNRYLNFHTGFTPFRREENQTSREAAESLLANTRATRVDLTGISVSQVLYVINRGLPVLGMLDENNAILLIAYTPYTITYVDPNTGYERTVSMAEMEEMMAVSGNTFIGYLP